MFNINDVNFRKLSVEDLQNGYLELLSNLTSCNLNINKEDLINRYNDIEKSDIIEIIVGVYNKNIISSVTLIFEKKFIRNLGIVCHVEDFVIHPEYQKLNIGSKLSELIKQKAKENNCYKIILDCSEDVKDFYIKQGYVQKSLGMALYINNNSNTK